MGNAIPNDSTICFDFFFTWTFHSNSAFLFLKVGPHVGQTREKILVLCQFYLSFGVCCSCALRKNVQYQIGTIEDFSLRDFSLNIAQLCGSQLIIEDEHINVFLFHEFLDLLEFSATYKRASIGFVQALDEGSE